MKKLLLVAAFLASSLGAYEQKTEEDIVAIASELAQEKFDQLTAKYNDAIPLHLIKVIHILHAWNEYDTQRFQIIYTDIVKDLYYLRMSGKLTNPLAGVYKAISLIIEVRTAMENERLDQDIVHGYYDETYCAHLADYWLLKKLIKEQKVRIKNAIASRLIS